MRNVEAGIVEGIMRGGKSHNGFSASFEWHIPKEPAPEKAYTLTTRTFPFNKHLINNEYGKMQAVASGMVTVYSEEHMSGLPKSIDFLKTESLNVIRQIDLSMYLGMVAVDIIMATQTSQLVEAIVVVSAEESQMMAQRERQYKPMQIILRGGDGVEGWQPLDVPHDGR